LPRGGRTLTGESDNTREKLRGMLRDGKLDDREVEVEMTDESNPLISVLGGQPGIDESALSGLKDMLGSFGRKTKRQKLKVQQAWQALTSQEIEKLIDQEAMTRSSAAFSALARTSWRLASLTSAMPTSTRSRMMLSTSRPT
jgi:ATP-dependent protease HslVU (ClpYQ) ATPase subunit